MPEDTCPICGLNAKWMPPPDSLARKLVRGVACDRCGSFFISEEASHELEYPGVEPQEKELLAGVTRERSEKDDPMVLWSSSYRPGSEGRLGFALTEAVALAPHSLAERLDRGLLNLARKCNYQPGKQILINMLQDFPLLFVESAEGMLAMLKHLVRTGHLEELALGFGGQGVYLLTVEGLAKAESLERPLTTGEQVFIAMWFAPEMDEAHTQGLRAGIEDAGCAPKRVDDHVFTEPIDAHITKLIGESRVLVADVTGQRTAVYFEIGLAMGLGLPVIFTCRKDDLANCCFDTRQYYHIVWESPEELREKVTARIRGLLASETS